MAMELNGRWFCQPGPAGVDGEPELILAHQTG